MNLKGSLPLLILHVLAEKPRHGYQIAQIIKVKSSGVLDFKEGTLYPALHNLEQQKYIDGFSETEKGRVRRYYRLNTKGRAVLTQELTEWQNYAAAVNRVLKGGFSA